MKKIENTDHPNNGHSGYLMPANEYALVSLREYEEPADVGEYFEIPTWARTDTVQKSEERKWDVMKGKRDTFKTHFETYARFSLPSLKMALKTPTTQVVLD